VSYKNVHRTFTCVLDLPSFPRVSLSSVATKIEGEVKCAKYLFVVVVVVVVLFSSVLSCFYNRTVHHNTMISVQILI